MASTATYAREYYHRTQDRQRVVRDARRAARYEFVNQFKRDLPCVDCGGTFHPVAMQFDHVRGTKASSVSSLAANIASEKRLLAEIAKCELRCANCHHIRHHYARGGA